MVAASPDQSSAAPALRPLAFPSDTASGTSVALPAPVAALAPRSSTSAVPTTRSPSAAVAAYSSAESRPTPVAAGTPPSRDPRSSPPRQAPWGTPAGPARPPTPAAHGSAPAFRNTPVAAP